MFSVRRYATYLGLAIFVVITFNYLRDGGLSSGSTTTGKGAYGTHVSEEGLMSARFAWAGVPVRNPVKKLTLLPSTPPKKLRQVQFQFTPETPKQATKRQERRAQVVHAFERSWKAYREHAWGKDELAPLSGGSKNGFGGWAATLVDNLDTLWIMGMKGEFEDAVSAAVDIDLGKVTTDQVNVFETTIRHLGGLLAAYDLSGDKRLLNKATEFGDMLLVAFDTPNRMPICRWRPQNAFKGQQEADSTVLVAEIGSLSMEFTRLSQLTGDSKWYDAVQRITTMFEEQQNDTHLPGMWPVTVNAKRKDLTQDTFFTLSAMSDSTYEYLPKMYALLGGVEDVYRKLFLGSMATAIKEVLFRPMTPDEADIMVSGNVRADTKSKKLEPQGQHLGCFTGGMFALGGRLFDEPDLLTLGRQLTDGCIWTYKASPLGIMPEVYYMVPVDKNSNAWNETKWKEEVVKRGGHEDLTADQLIAQSRLPKGISYIRDTRYILRPEAIESVFILYRITGKEYLLDAAWEMFQSIERATRTHLAYAALSDVTFSAEQLRAGNTGGTTQMDSMESFWMAETLKYFYLIFSEPNVISLDEYVFNTEAHPFRRPTAI